MRALAVPLLLVFAVLPAVPVLGQGHAHADEGAQVLIMSDVPPGGRAVVGGVTHFAYVLLDEDGAPLPHHDVHVAVVLNEVVLYETQSAHDYDGVGGLDIVFPVTGTYTVTVAAPYEGSTIEAVYDGYVVAPESILASVEAELPIDPATNALAPFTISILNESGGIVPHTDALVEIRRVADDFSVLSFHGHIHHDPIYFEYSFEQAGAYAVRVVAYTAFPSPDDIVFPVVVYEGLVTARDGAPPVEPGAPAVPDLPGAAGPETAPVPGEMQNFLVADPATGTDMQVGPFGQVRASMVTYNMSAMELVQHLNYEAILEGPRGPIFRSNSLHEYDGVLEVMSADQGLGAYMWTITVKGDGWTDTKALTYEVRPVVLPLGVGPQFIEARYDQALLAAGLPQAFELYAHGVVPSVPFMHSEVALEVRNNDGLPILSHKLHTHDDGLFGFVFTFPEPGEYTMQRDLFDIHGGVTPVYYGESVMAPKGLDLRVPEGLALPARVVDEAVVAEAEAVPATGAFMLIVTLALLVALVRRR